MKGAGSSFANEIEIHGFEKQKVAENEVSVAFSLLAFTRSRCIKLHPIWPTALREL